MNTDETLVQQLDLRPVAIVGDSGSAIFTSNDRKLLMTSTYIASTTGSQEILDEWVKGMEFMNSIQGFTIIQDKTDEQTKLAALPWAKCLLERYPDARDKVFFIMRSPFKKLTGDLWGICMVTAEGDFISLTELAVIEEITQETLLSIFSGEAYKDPVIK